MVLEERSFVLSSGPNGVARRESPQGSPPPSARPLQKGETARACLVCATALRIPDGVRVFRCSECDTVNGSPPSAPSKPLERSEIYAFEASIPHHRNWPTGVEPDMLLTGRTHKVFSSLQCIDRSFTAHGSLDEPLEMDIVQRFYALLAKDEAARNILIANLQTLLLRPSLNDDVQGNEPFWRWSVILTSCPFLLERSDVVCADEQRNLLGRLFGLIINLPSPQQHRLCRYWARNEKACLHKLVVVANALMAHRLAICKANNDRAYMQDWRLAAAVKILSLCLVANKRAKERGFPDPLSADAFYNVSVDMAGATAIVQDFEVFKRLPKLAKEGSPTPFVFCSYPFLLSMGLKQALLTYENRKAMASSARTALRSTISGASESPVLTLRVRRSHIVQDSLEQLFTHRSQLKKPLRITFIGEEGIDAGGLLKEWLLLLSAELFRPQYGMFTFDEESQLCWFNECAPSAETEAEFFLVGVVCGLAVYSASPIDIPLPLAAFKMLGRITPNFEDFKSLHPALARGLEMLLAYDGDVENTFCRTFVVEREVYGKIEEVELMPGGRDIAVTEANRQEFVELLQKYRFSAAKRQFSAFAKGFMQVCGGNALSLFSAHELELLVRGQEPSKLDIAQLQACASIEGWPGGSSDPTVELFWRYLGGLSSKEQRKLLAFICGSGRLPATGALKLRLTCGGKANGRLPTSHTCFSQLVLPRYKSLSDMSKALKTACHESKGFGLR